MLLIYCIDIYSTEKDTCESYPAEYLIMETNVVNILY